MLHSQSLIWLFGLIILLTPLLVALVFSRQIGKIYQLHFADARRERLFLSSTSFFVTFAIVRFITHSIHSGVGPLHNIYIGGNHMHHLVLGILLILLVGYLWLVQVGTGV